MQRADVAVSFDGTEGPRGQAYLRRPASHVQQQSQGRTGPSPAHNGPGPGPGPGLPFMTFDLASGSGSNAPLSHNSGYGGSSSIGGYASFEDEPPLLEELGINVGQITQKMLNLLNPFKVDPSLHEDPDLSGPFLFCIIFGLAQLLSGKLHFGVILGWTSVASVFLYLLYNLLAGRNGSIDLYRCVSLVGYSLVPVVVFSIISIFLPKRSIFRYILGAVTVLWSSNGCTNLMIFQVPHGGDFRSLIAYPCALIYVAFSLLVIF